MDFSVNTHTLFQKRGAAVVQTLVYISYLQWWIGDRFFYLDTVFGESASSKHGDNRCSDKELHIDCE